MPMSNSWRPDIPISLGFEDWSKMEAAAREKVKKAREKWEAEVKERRAKENPNKTSLRVNYEESIDGGSDCETDNAKEDTDEEYEEIDAMDLDVDASSLLDAEVMD
ncbi:hypothetical protein ACJZ2D_016022 [Fusarium nematophilum]